MLAAENFDETLTQLRYKVRGIIAFSIALFICDSKSLNDRRRIFKVGQSRVPLSYSDARHPSLGPHEWCSNEQLVFYHR